MSRRNELRVQLSLSRVDIRIASAPACPVLLVSGGRPAVGWAQCSSRSADGKLGPQFGAVRCHIWGETTCLLLGSGPLGTGKLQGCPLWPSGGHGTLAWPAWEGGRSSNASRSTTAFRCTPQHCTAPVGESNLRQREERCPELHNSNLDPRTQPKMPTEKELQISPIVQESVVHNTKVSDACALAPSSVCRQLTKPIHPGPRQPPVSDSLPLRCRGRHTRPRVVRRVPLLHRLHPADGSPLLRHPRRPGLPLRREACLRHESLLPRAAGAMD